MGNYQCKCHRCGKIFFGGDLSNWAYKMNGYYFCSWGCYRSYEKEENYRKKEFMRHAKRTVHK